MQIRASHNCAVSVAAFSFCHRFFLQEFDWKGNADRLMLLQRWCKCPLPTCPVVVRPCDSPVSEILYASCSLLSEPFAFSTGSLVDRIRSTQSYLHMRSSNAKKGAGEWISNFSESFSNSFSKTAKDDVSSSDSEGETATREASVRKQRGVRSSQPARAPLSGATSEDHLIEGNGTQGGKPTAQL